jgi:hypothetical protein
VPSAIVHAGTSAAVGAEEQKISEAEMRCGGHGGIDASGRRAADRGVLAA